MIDRIFDIEEVAGRSKLMSERLLLAESCRSSRPTATQLSPCTILYVSARAYQMEQKIDRLRSLMRANDWAAALSMASKFPRLGKHRAAITRAHEAIHYRDFYEQLGKDPEQLVTEGITALKERYNHTK